MTLMTSDKTFPVYENTCPSLGMLEDIATFADYPSESNYCHHCKPISVPRFEYQRAFCQNNKYSTCPVFLRKDQTALPDNIRMHDHKHSQQRKSPWWILSLIIGILLVGAGIILIQSLSGKTESAFNISASNQAVSLTSLAKIALTRKVSLTLTEPSVSDQNTVAPTSIPSITPVLVTVTPNKNIHRLEIPIGISYQFVIHRMKQGESLGNLATQYKTSVEAIKLVNYYLPEPVWIDWLVIIPVGITNVSGMPSFDAYMVVEGEITIEDLASTLALDASMIKLYNGFRDGYILSAGEWVLIPHSRT